MKEDTKATLFFWAVIVIIILMMMVLCLFICNELKAESIEILVIEYPFWADSTFQTVQIVKCWEMFPNGQRELLGYKVTVDSSGIRIYEEKPVWFLNWATFRALNLRGSLTKK